MLRLCNSDSYVNTFHRGADGHAVKPDFTELLLHSINTTNAQPLPHNQHPQDNECVFVLMFNWLQYTHTQQQ